MLAAFRFEVFKFSSFHFYQKCPFKNFYHLYNILKVSKTSKLQLQTRPTFTAIALQLSRDRFAPKWTPQWSARVRVSIDRYGSAVIYTGPEWSEGVKLPACSSGKVTGLDVPAKIRGYIVRPCVFDAHYLSNFDIVIFRFRLIRRNHNLNQIYRGTSLARRRTPLGPYCGPMPMFLGGF